MPVPLGPGLIFLERWGMISRQRTVLYAPRQHHIFPNEPNAYGTVWRDFEVSKA